MSAQATNSDPQFVTFLSYHHGFTPCGHRHLILLRTDGCGCQVSDNYCVHVQPQVLTIPSFFNCTSRGGWYDVNDIIMQTAMEAHSEINLHKLFGTKLGGYCQVSSRSTYGILWGMEFSALIPKKTLKCFVHKEELELTWQIPLNESRPKETEAVCVDRFHLSLWTSMAICRIMYIIT